MDSNAADGAHPLVARVVSGIRSLVDGNCASAADLAVGRASCHDRGVALALDSAVGWRTEVGSATGRRDAGGSIRMAGRAAATVEAKARCDALIGEPSTWEALARYLEGRPYELFRSLEPGFLWSAVPRGWSFVEACRSCGGSGRRRCSVCDAGWVTCSACGGSARGSCSSCFGSAG